MLQSIWEDIRKEFNYGNMVNRIIIVNVSVFILITLFWLILRITNGWNFPVGTYDSVLRFFLISSDWWHNLTHPWVFFTSMFMHEGLFHILWNMVFLYWFGRIVGDFIGDHRVLPIYLLGGLAGNIAFFVILGFFSSKGSPPFFALGASGAVMAIAVASAVLAPNYIIRLLLIGDVKLKYVVLVLLLLDLFFISRDNNTGGHIAHLGGAAMGGVFVLRLRSGQDLSEPVNRILAAIRSFLNSPLPKIYGKKKGPKMAYRNPVKTATGGGKSAQAKGSRPSEAGINGLSYQEQLDAILDKIKQSGYESLTKEEKEFLFNASKD
ncbi:MAG: rhomboid family intramembrane serine protease [Saprospiraceae bacterium]|nr:rhomboid family intramembrane serine protease [Saprospiraceae bacterium]